MRGRDVCCRPLRCEIALWIQILKGAYDAAAGLLFLSCHVVLILFYSYKVRKSRYDCYNCTPYSMEYYDAPLPLCKWYLKYFWEGKLPTQVYQKYGIKNNFKLPDAAFRLLHFECALEDSPRLFQILQYMQATSLIQHT